MAEELGGLKIKLGLDGTEFQQGIQQVNREMKVLESAFKAQGAGVDNFGKSIDGLKSKSSMLTGQIDLQKQKFQALKEQLDKSIQSTGEYSKNSQNLKIQVNNVEKSIKNLESELKKTNDEITRQSSNWIKFGNSMKSAGDKLKGVGEGFKDVGTKLSLGLTAPIVAAGGAAFKLASDMNETLNKVDVAFKDNANEVKAWGDTTLEKFGIAKGSALDMAALFGDMGTSMGLSTDKAAQMSMGLTGLAGDLASFKNIGIQQASDALKGIFTGETESLKGLGIVMLDANLKAYALSKGIKTKYEAMSNAEKVTLRYQYILDQTKNSEGDFARTSDGTANQMRIFQESIKQLAAQIGQNLIPILTPIIQKLNEMLKSFSTLSPAVQKTILIVAGIAAVIGPVLVVIGQVITAVSAIAGAFSAASGAIAAAGGILAVITGPVGIAIAVVAGLIAIGVLLYKNWDTIKAKCSELGAYLSVKMQEIGTFFSTVWTGIVSFLSSTWETIKNVVTVGIMLIGSILQGAFTIITLPFRFIWENCKEEITTAWNFISEKINAVINFIKDQVIMPVFNSIKGFITETWNSIKSVIGTTLRYISDNIIKPIFNSIKTTTQNIWNGIKNTISTVWNGILNVVNQIAGPIKNAASNIFEAIKNSINDKIESAKSIVRTGLDSIKNFFSGLMLKLPNIKLPHFKLNGSFSINPPRVPTLGVDWYAEGGIFNGPRIIGVGEAGTEAVLPIDRLDELMARAIEKVKGNNAVGNLTLNIENFINNTNKDIEQIAYELEFYRKRVATGRGGI